MKTTAEPDCLLDLVANLEQCEQLLRRVDLRHSSSDRDDEAYFLAVRAAKRIAEFLCDLSGQHADEAPRGSLHEAEVDKTVKLAYVYAHVGNLVLDPAGTLSFDDIDCHQVVDHRALLFEKLNEALREGKPLRDPSQKGFVFTAPLNEDQLSALGGILRTRSAGHMWLGSSPVKGQKTKVETAALT